MKNLRIFILLLLFLVIPSYAKSNAINPVLGNLEPSNKTVILSDYVIESYKAFDNYYIPVSRHRDAGCFVDCDPVTGKISISANKMPPSKTAKPTNWANASFTLSQKQVYLGGFKTHCIDYNGKLLIPIDALNFLWDIQREDTTYKLISSTSFPVKISDTLIENTSADVIELTVSDLYWDDCFVSASSTYTLSPYETIKREPAYTSLNENLIYISTLISECAAQNMYFLSSELMGQQNDELFSAYTKVPTLDLDSELLLDLEKLNYGDPISRDKVLAVEQKINTKNLSSPTPFLVWTNLETQRTYIFGGYENNWTLIKHFICSTGKKSTPTPKGKYALTRKVPYFGVEKGYRCKNAFGFIGTSYLYHSIIFDKTGTYLLEGKGVLGKPASDGCIRFSVENSEWFYKNLVSGTTVFID